MEQKISIIKDVELKTLKVTAKVRYWEDATVNGEDDEFGDLIPFRHGENWIIEIYIDPGIVKNWPVGTKADVHYKVCDCGIYELYDDHDQFVAKLEGYVPSCMPGDHYGDYIILNIDEVGKITNWKPQPDFSDFNGDSQD